MELCTYIHTDIIRCKIKKWKKRSKNRSDWRKSMKEAKVRKGLYCHLRRRRRGGGGRKRR